MTKTLQHISHSGMRDYKKCGFYFKVTRLEEHQELKKEKNIYTEFGQAVHKVLELATLKQIPDSEQSLVDNFNKYYDEYSAQINVNVPSEKIKEEFRKQGEKLVVLALPALREEFGDFEVINAEEELYEDFSHLKFKGLIDLVIRAKNGKYYIIDWKTTTWGWHPKKKSDPLVTYQLTYYKHFFAKKYNIDVKDIETYFILLKRTPKTNNVEVLRVTSGPRKTKNALKLLDETLYNIENKRFIKNRLSCEYCDLHRTKFCP